MEIIGDRSVNVSKLSKASGVCRNSIYNYKRLIADFGCLAVRSSSLVGVRAVVETYVSLPSVSSSTRAKEYRKNALINAMKRQGAYA